MELESRFSTDKACRSHLASLRWPDGFVCPRCAHRDAWEKSTGFPECAITTPVSLPEPCSSGRQTEKKAMVVIAAQVDGKRIGRIRTRRIPDASGEHLMAFVSASVAPGSLVHTDGWAGYAGLLGRGYRQKIYAPRGPGSVQENHQENPHGPGGQKPSSKSRESREYPASLKAYSLTAYMNASDAARVSKRVQAGLKTSLTTSVGPLRCLATMSSVTSVGM